MTRFLFSVWQLRFSLCGSPSLTIGLVRNLLVQLILGFAKAVPLGSKSHRTHDHLSLSHLRLPQPVGPGSHIYIPQEQGSPVTPPRTGISFHRLFRLARLHTGTNSVQNQTQSYLTTESQSVSLSWCQATIRARDKSFFVLEIFLRQLRICYFVAPSLRRGGACNLMLILGIPSAVALGSESRRTQGHILLSQFLRLPQPGGLDLRIYNPQEQGGPVIPPSSSYITTDSQSASLSWCQAPIWGPRPISLLLSWIILRQLRICWWGAASLTRNRVCSFQFCWASPAQPSSGLSTTGLNIFYCPYFLDSPKMEGQVPVFVSPRNRVDQLYPRALGLSN
jgi:hypothetical protein